MYIHNPHMLVRFLVKQILYLKKWLVYLFKKNFQVKYVTVPRNLVFTFQLT